MYFKVNYGIYILLDLFIKNNYDFNIKYTEWRTEECGNSVCELENQTETGHTTLGKLLNCFSSSSPKCKNIYLIRLLGLNEIM